MIETIAFILGLMPLLGLWAAWKMFTWHRFYGTRFLWGLFLASMASAVAAAPVAFISIRRLLLGPTAPPFPQAAIMLGFSLILLEGVFVYLVLRWSDLDEDMKRARTGTDDSTDSTNRPPGDTFHSEDS